MTCPNCAVKDRQIAALESIIAELSGDPDQIILDEMIAGYERSLKEMKDRKVRGDLLCEPYDPLRLPRHKQLAKDIEAVLCALALIAGVFVLGWCVYAYARNAAAAVEKWAQMNGLQ